MKKIKSFMLATMAFALAAPVFTSCGDDETKVETVEKIIDNIVSEYSVNDNMVADQKAKSGKNTAVLLVAFGSTWNNAFQAFDATKKAYEKAFPEADVYLCFSSDICINRASVGENTDDEGKIVKRDYYEPRYLLHAIGAAKYGKIYVQSLQVIPGEEFAAVVASVKKFMNNGFLANAHLDDKYLSKLAEDEAIFLGMPLLNDSIEDINEVAKQLNEKCKSEISDGVVAFMGHGNPDKYDTFKANIRYRQLETALQKLNPNYFVGTVDMENNYKQDVMDRMKKKGITNGKVYLHALMSIAGDHAHNDMAGEGEEYWDEEDPESEDNSWFEYFTNNEYTPVVPAVNNHPQGLLEIPGILEVWINHTKNAKFLEDAYHSMYPEE
ncbi:sirohydrochlorin cobaltochelatase [Prevotella sp. E9-3]|uniref:sirohydrochlorin cobaltochelatase n=1 Tax=Prevotella sp. E9-3 TaxID=2913621 RepID=UPI001EDA899E|nr:sirohydrochlorin cobaltochelatase [Prevotella sp. E9-3]UKK47763.1 sirohydrochlorin cobaltochelatase [Prevotella sp. E9-3]